MQNCNQLFVCQLMQGMIATKFSQGRNSNNLFGLNSKRKRQFRPHTLWEMLYRKPIYKSRAWKVEYTNLTEFFTLVSIF